MSSYDETAGRSTADQVKDQVQDKAEQARSRARVTLRDQVDRRSTQAGEQVQANADDVRGIAEELRKQGKDGSARIAEQVADRAENVGKYLQGADADRILRDVEDFARRRPWAVAAGGLLLGLAASRFLKASSAQRYRSDQEGRPFAATGTATTADPAWTGSDYGTEPSFADTGTSAAVAGTFEPVIDPADTAGSAYEPATEPTEPYTRPLTEPGDPTSTRRDPDPRI